MRNNQATVPNGVGLLDDEKHTASKLALTACCLFLPDPHRLPPPHRLTRTPQRSKGNDRLTLAVAEQNIQGIFPALNSADNAPRPAAMPSDPLPFPAPRVSLDPSRSTVAPPSPQGSSSNYPNLFTPSVNLSESVRGGYNPRYPLPFNNPTVTTPTNRASNPGDMFYPDPDGGASVVGGPLTDAGSTGSGGKGGRAGLSGPGEGNGPAPKSGEAQDDPGLLPFVQRVLRPRDDTPVLRLCFMRGADNDASAVQLMVVLPKKVGGGGWGEGGWAVGRWWWAGAGTGPPASRRKRRCTCVKMSNAYKRE